MRPALPSHQNQMSQVKKTTEKISYKSKGKSPKKLAHRNQQYIKRLIHHEEVRFILLTQRWHMFVHGGDENVL